MTRELCHRLITLRRNHPAWLLLASRNGPLTIASLKSLIETHASGVAFEVAVEHLAESFALHANDSEFDLGEDLAIAARRELRQWLKRGLIVEREGQLLATDALQRSLLFLDSLEEEAMTSTASRLATVQRAIDLRECKYGPSTEAKAESGLEIVGHSPGAGIGTRHPGAGAERT